MRVGECGNEKRKINENFFHECHCSRQRFEGRCSTISDFGYAYEDFKSIYDFYVAHAPIKMDESTRTNMPIASLRDFGWKGNASLQSLERKLLRESGIQSFVILKSNRIDGTLESMNLTGDICCQHPRAVLKMEAKTTVEEDGSVSVSSSETRMICLFRHIRNSLAHGLTYSLSPDTMLIEDRDDDGVTARMVIKKTTLVDWIEVVRSGPDSSGDMKK